MARDFGTYDSSPFRTEANVDPFKTYVQGGMTPTRPTGTTQPKTLALNSAQIKALLPLLMKLMASGAKGNPMQNIMALLGGAR